MEHLVSDLLILSRMQNPDYELNVEVLNVIAVAPGCDAWNAYSYAGEKIDGQCYL